MCIDLLMVFIWYDWFVRIESVYKELNLILKQMHNKYLSRIQEYNENIFLVNSVYLPK